MPRCLAMSLANWLILYDVSRLDELRLETLSVPVRPNDGPRSASAAPDGQPHGRVSGNPYHRQFGSNVIQIEPANSTSEVVFLNVLTATDASHTIPQQAAYRVTSRGAIVVEINGATSILKVPEWFSK